jgi:hypothetical protein
LPDLLKRDLASLAQADQRQSFRRHCALRVVQQYLVGLAFEFLGLHQIAQRASKGSIEQGRILFGQSLSFTMREYQHLGGCGLRSSNLYRDLHDLHSCLLVHAVSDQPGVQLIRSVDGDSSHPSHVGRPYIFMQLHLESYTKPIGQDPLRKFTDIE